MNTGTQAINTSQVRSRRLGTLLYASGVIGLIATGFMLRVVDRLKYEEPAGVEELIGLEEPVEVVWDRHGVWHLHGQSWEDLLRAQGWMHASDRLWQMELGRLAAEGRLAEMFGSLALPADRVMRTLGFCRAARAQVEGLPGGIRRRLQAYADGVNAYLESAAYRAPPEFVMLGWEPEPWDLEDSALLLSMISLVLSSNWAQEAVRASLEDRFEAGDVALLLPDTFEGPYIIGGAEYPGGVDVLQAGFTGDGSCGWEEIARGTLALKEFLGIPTGGAGSNSWVVSGARTRSGRPLLANDPHLGVQIPSLWVSGGLHLDGHDLVGVMIPGLPSVVIGRTGSFAWGFTNTMADNQDLYVEKVVEDDPEKYWFRGEKLPFEIRTETIRVRGAEPEVLGVRSTLHGPVINDVLPLLLHGAEEVSGATMEGSVPTAPGKGVDAGDWARRSPPVTLRWTALEPGGELLTVAGLLEARNWNDLRGVFESFRSPGQNVVYADTSGLIAYQFTGAIPVRRTWDGSHPVPGWSGEYEWDGYVAYDDLPRLVDPPEGIIVTANNRPAVPDEGPFLARWWSAPYRARRIWERLAPVDMHTVAGFEDMQRDVVSRAALDLLAEMEGIKPAGGYTGRALELLAGWDGSLTRMGPGALYGAFSACILEEILLDELGEAGLRDYKAMSEFFGGKPVSLLRLLRAPSACWWDDRSTEHVESMEEVVERAWERAWHEVTDRFGRDPERWSWGGMHPLVLRHPMGRFWPLSSLMNRGPVGLPGDNDTVFNTTYPYSRPYGVMVASSWRHIVEFTSPVTARDVLPTGNSGHFLSPFYDDQLDDWAAGRTHPAATTWREALGVSVRSMQLVPGGLLP